MVRPRQSHRLAGAAKLVVAVCIALAVTASPTALAAGLADACGKAATPSAAAAAVEECKSFPVSPGNAFACDDINRQSSSETPGESLAKVFDTIGTGFPSGSHEAVVLTVCALLAGKESLAAARDALNQSSEAFTELCKAAFNGFAPGAVAAPPTSPPPPAPPTPSATALADACAKVATPSATAAAFKRCEMFPISRGHASACDHIIGESLAEVFTTMATTGFPSGSNGDIFTVCALLAREESLAAASDALAQSSEAFTKLCEAAFNGLPPARRDHLRHHAIFIVATRTNVYVSLIKGRARSRFCLISLLRKTTTAKCFVGGLLCVL